MTFIKDYPQQSSPKLSFKSHLMILLICIVLMAISIVWVLMDGMDEGPRAPSELHARDRYAMAEKMDKEFDRK